MAELSEGILLTAVSGLSYGVGLLCSDRVHRMYEPITTVTGAYKNQNDFVVPFRQVIGSVLGSRIPSTVDHFYLNMAHINKVMCISENIGMQSAFWVGFLGTAGNFLLSWKWRESRPLVVDIMEGAILGAAIGCIPVAFSKNLDSRGVQWITGIGVGFVTGMLGSCVASVSAYVAKKVFVK